MLIKYNSIYSQEGVVSSSVRDAEHIERDAGHGDGRGRYARAWCNWRCHGDWDHRARDGSGDLRPPLDLELGRDGRHGSESGAGNVQISYMLCLYNNTQFQQASQLYV